MQRIRFNNCLNQEIKVWNISVIGLVMGGLLGLILGLVKGLLWGLAASTVGLAIGGWLGRQWWMGNIQRWLYWHLPISKLLFGRVIPKSYHRHLM